MKRTSWLLLLLMPLLTLAQDNGIQFETGLSWQQIKEKAKAENKPIFMDCFTTWCGPCKYMEQKVLSQKNVGDFMNKNFICVKVQMDQTNHDSSTIKAWYKDAAAIKEVNNIHSYPTYLFF